MQVTEERRAREASEETLVQILKQMIETVRSDIDHERETRLKAEESLLSLLENSMNKLKWWVWEFGRHKGESLNKEEWG